MIGTGAMCDPYLYLEKDLQYTRKCLEVIDKYGFGVSILTKSAMILRDLDVLKSIHSKSKCVVQMTLTTADNNLCKIIEPNVSTTSERFEVLKTMRDNGIPTVVWLDPFLPFINDTQENLRELIDMCIEAKVHGILCFGIGLTLREGNREYFYQKLDQHFPGMKEKYIQKFGNSYGCTSDNNQRLMSILEHECNKNTILTGVNKIFEYLSLYEENDNEQLSFF